MLATKTANTVVATIGDIIGYTVSLQNTGSTITNSIFFIDAIQDGTAFIPGTVAINGSTLSTADPNTGFSVPNIGAGQTTVITFQVSVTNVPPINPVPNTAQIDYSFIIDPNSAPVQRSTTSNTTFVQINAANIVSLKTANTDIAVIGEVLTFTTTLTNTGNIAAISAIFTDAIPEGTTFIENSLSINNLIQPGVNPENGVIIGTILPNETVSIAFQAQLTSIPSNNTVINTSTTAYGYQISPDTPIIQRTSFSNTVSINVRTANIQAIKSADRSITRIGQIITYTVAVTNAGVFDITNTILIDALANGTAFVPNSILVDSIPRPNETPTTGITLNTLIPNQTVIVTFQVSVMAIPTQNPIPNVALIHYEYQPIPNTPPISETTSSNTTSIEFIDAILVAMKMADKVLANIGDTINYTVSIQNTGSASANSIFFTDTILDGTIFIPGTVAINSITLPSADPNIGFSVLTIAPGQTTTITFQVSVTNLPTVNPTPNTATIDYDFIFDPNSAPIQKSTISNTTLVQINDADIVSLKTANMEAVTIGDTLTFTTTLTNIGDSDAISVIFTDLIPEGTTFIEDSLSINNVPQPGVNPSAGVLVGNIAPNVTTPITFSVTIVAIPPSGRIQNQSSSRYTFNGEEQTSTSNFTFTDILSANVVATKTTPIQYADLQTIIPYTISILNNGNIQIENITVTDIIPANTSFIANSVIVNGIARPNDDPQTGIQIDSIPSTTTATVLFQVRITSIPQINPISNTSTVEYQYTLPNRPPITETITSSAAITEVNHADLDSNKAVDRTFAAIGDTLTYTITLNQTGNVPANDVNVVDLIPEGTTFIEDSVIVNGQPLQNVDPATGIPVGTIGVSGSVTVSFQVRVTSIPTPNTLNNFATTTFSYVVNPTEPPILITQQTNIVSTTVINPIVTISKNANRLTTTVGDTITFALEVTNQSSIPTISTSVVDTIPDGTTFVEGSVTIDGIPFPNVRPDTGIEIGSLLPEENATITFETLVTSIPSSNTIINSAIVTAAFQLTPQDPIIRLTFDSNVVSISVQSITTTVIKDASVSSATLTQYFDYTIRITNTSTVPLTSVSLQDIVPTGLRFINGTVLINGIPSPLVDPNIGFLVTTNLEPNETVTISFTVQVISAPTNNEFDNTATATLQLQTSPTDPPIIVTIISNENTVLFVPGVLPNLTCFFDGERFIRGNFFYDWYRGNN
nr:hypothetical protein [Priestia taiwanensis]